MPISFSTVDLTPAPSQSGSEILRPISYLGSKLRSVDSIIEVRRQICRTPIKVLDPFVGSSVVAQAFAQNRDTVVASDAMRMCRNMASATLCGSESKVPILAAAAAKVIESHQVQWAELYQEFVDTETRLIANGSAAELIGFCMQVPQVWRDKEAKPELAKLFSELRANVGQNISQSMPVIAAYYGATYFGLYQALEIDRLWQSILALQRDEEVDQWVIDSLFTALFSAASCCTFTAGKHFAQPYLISANRINDYALRRVLEDRRISVEEKFKKCVEDISNNIRIGGDEHRVVNCLLEDWTAEEIREERIDLIYADPPYTAQQYSRFYHITETLSHGRIPDLQIFRGAVTRGIYPTKRFKSNFCSKRAALPAFEHLLNLGAQSGASILLSYSFSNSTTGNARMVQLEDILSLHAVKTHQLTPKIYRLPHQYRSFTSTDHEGAEDWEALILLTNNAATISRK